MEGLPKNVDLFGFIVKRKLKKKLEGGRIPIFFQKIGRKLEGRRIEKSTSRIRREYK